MTKIKLRIHKFTTPGALLKLNGNCFTRNTVGHCFAKAAGISLSESQKLEHSIIDFYQFCLASLIPPGDLPDKHGYSLGTIQRYCQEAAREEPTLFSEDMNTGHWVAIFDLITDACNQGEWDEDKPEQRVSVFQKLLSEHFEIEYEA